jgi:murein DD-endopeptidase MepM/ murein hydrolase activator NlpD
VENLLSGAQGRPRPRRNCIRMPPRRIGLVALGIGLLVALGVPAALAQSLEEQQADVQAQIGGLEDKIASAKEQEGLLTSEIEAASSRISTLEGDIGALSARIAELERDLAAHRAKLDRLRALFAEQSRDLEHLKRQYELAQLQLEERLVDLYQNEEADSFSILLQVQSLADLLDQLEYFNDIGRQDQAISAEIERLKVEMREARERTRATKAKVAAATEILADETAEQIAAQEALVAEQEALAAARADKRGLLVGVREHRHEAEEDLDAMQAASAALAEQILAAQQSAPSGSSGSGVSSSGFIWPVNGVVTSGFGWRWGRMHEGIDISAPSGTSIKAVAAGTVIYTGYMGGYGNLTIIDHGNGLATAYAHQSAIYVSGGSVSQGTVIGAVGCTGSCTGNHLHFEVRVNGSPVDPMGYL